MPTEEYTPLLDRADAVQRATPLIEASSPLLRELVNHACWAFRRCIAASDNLGNENEDTAPFVLYRHLIELVDGIETLFSASCVDAAVPLLRSAFEASLSLDYILQDNYAQRSLSWTCGYVHARIAAHQRLDGNTSAGRDMAAAWSRENTHGIDLVPTPYDSVDPVAKLNVVLGRPGLQPIEAEYQRLLQQRGRRGPPEWFQLFDGPANRRQLAMVVGREAEYLSLYGEWSNFSHGADASPYLRAGAQPGEAAFLAVRSPHNIQHRAALAVGMMVRSTRQVIGHFRHGEDLSAWYNREIRGGWNDLRRLRVNVGDE